jgi:site-specific recombinase XerD
MANITFLEIGRTLIKDGTTWSFDIPAEETKAGRPHLAILPDWSTPCIDRYVDHYRPLFRNAETTSRLWLSRNGRPLDDSSLYHLVCKRTYEAFGKPINPHLFRSCLATSTAVHHGANMGLAMTVLGHQSSKVTTRHYNQAKMIDAVRAYQEVLLADPQGRG